MNRTILLITALMCIHGSSYAQIISPLSQNRSLTAHAKAIDFDRPFPDDLIEETASLSTNNFEPFEADVVVSAVGSRTGSNATASQNSVFSQNRVRATGAANSAGEFALDASSTSHLEYAFSLAQDLSYTMEVSLAGGLESGPEPSESNPSFSLVGPSGDLARLNPNDLKFIDLSGGLGDSFEGFASASSTGQLAEGEYVVRAIAGSNGGRGGQASFDFDLRVAPLPTGFHNISSITASTSGSDLWPASNLIQGPDVGFQAEAPFEKTSSGANGNWVTDACGFPCDYLDSQEPPVLTIDLGSDQDLSEIDLWGYESTNANGARGFSIRFATDSDGTNGFGTSIDYNPVFAGLSNDDTNRRQPYLFDRKISARYVELTLTDNFFTAPGDGSEGEVPGGDRIGLGEIAFPIHGGVRGDFDQNGVLDVGDIDRLASQSANATNDPNFDLTNDGLVDFSDILNWVKDLAASSIGDSNVDGIFNSSDLIQVFASGRYEKDLPASWSQGDWNGDGRFNSGDLVQAFADGGYTSAVVANVPEPTGSLILMVCMFFVVSQKRE